MTNCRTFPNPTIKPRIQVAVFMDLCVFHPDCGCMANIYAHPCDIDEEIGVSSTPCEKDGEIHDQTVLESAVLERWHRINECAQGFAFAHEGEIDCDAEVVN